VTAYLGSCCLGLAELGLKIGELELVLEMVEVDLVLVMGK
jgi:hypothetical protein